MTPEFHPAAQEELAAAVMIGDMRAAGLGLELLRETQRVVALMTAAGAGGTVIPDMWIRYPCAEYFEGPWSKTGFLDERSRTWVVHPEDRLYERIDAGFMAVGRSGVDGIDFGYRLDRDGIWALYPIEVTFKFMAANLDDLVQGWTSGSLSV